MRLFTAVWPAPAARADLDALLADLDRRRWRPTAPERRHVTLAFHGDGADPDEHARRLHALPAIGELRLRCAGAGRFGGALWLGVEADDPARLETLAVVAGADPERFVPHLTVARDRRREDDDEVPEVLTRHRGPWWPLTEVTLVASGPRYRIQDRVVVA